MDTIFTYNGFHGLTIPIIFFFSRVNISNVIHPTMNLIQIVELWTQANLNEQIVVLECMSADVRACKSTYIHAQGAHPIFEGILV